MVLAIIALPLLASIITGLFNKVISIKLASTLTCGAMIISSILSLAAFYKVGIKGEIIHIYLWEWLNVGTLKANITMYIDQLSAIMLIVITLVSSVVHVYSIGYMSEDKNLPRFMSYLSLFTVFMLILVTSDNFLQLFLGWEGVGLCSYLLIGFWYKKTAANFASVKAFVVNRVGDFAFILGIIVIYTHFGSVEFASVFADSEKLAESVIHLCCFDVNAIELICILLFVGSMGKSAQIGLHVWLPDAMEGPTPVSALIHAATMVTAGVFLVARCSYLFEYAPIARDFILIIGSITCLFAAIIALCQNDIKKIIAYSTCSQLGYMFMAAGLSSYQAGIFHLYTHAFFKAMLFLAAGSVIHAVHEQDISKMGGLRKYMPITYGLFWLGSLAIMGIFPFAGHYSKDLILNTAFDANTRIGNFAYTCGLMAAFCTAIYSTKIIVKVFHGTSHNKDKHHPISESPKIMNMPLSILAFGTVFAGYYGANILNIETPTLGFFKNSIFVKEYDIKEHVPLSVEMMPTIVAILGMMIGYVLFSSKLSKTMAKTFRPIHTLILNKFYFDEIYNVIFVRLNDSIACLLKCFDKKAIDFAGPTLSASISLYSSRRVASVHNGRLGFYALAMVLGMVIALSVLVFKYVVV